MIVSHRRLMRRVIVFAAGALAAAVGAGAASAQQASSAPGIEVAVSLPLSGEGNASFGRGTLEGIRFAIEEANAGATGPHITLTVYDDKGEDDEARAVARRIAASRAVLVLGPSYSTSSLAAGPVLRRRHAGLARMPRDRQVDDRHGA